MAYFGKNQRDIWWNNTRGKFRGSREDMKNTWVLALSRPTYEVSKLCLCVTNMSLSTTPNQVASINSILFLSFFINYFDHHGKKYDTSKLFEWTQNFRIVPDDKKQIMKFEIFDYDINRYGLIAQQTNKKPKTGSHCHRPERTSE